MIRIIDNIETSQKEIIEAVVDLHIKAFEGFFLSSLHRGFLRVLYKSFIEHESSELLIAADDSYTPVGFIAYSWDTSGVYSYMLKRHFFLFVWYSFLSFIKKPSILKKMFSALAMPSKSKRDECYYKIFSIGVDPDCQTRGIGTMLIDELKSRVDFEKYRYITLETDAENNDQVNQFYINNGFSLSSVFYTFEGRKMNKYHYRAEPEFANRKLNQSSVQESSGHNGSAHLISGHEAAAC